MIYVSFWSYLVLKSKNDKFKTVSYFSNKIETVIVVDEGKISDFCHG